MKVVQIVTGKNRNVKNINSNVNHQVLIVVQVIIVIIDQVGIVDPDVVVKVKKRQEDIQDRVQEDDHGQYHAEIVISILVDGHVLGHHLGRDINRHVIKEPVRGRDRDIEDRDLEIRIEDGHVPDVDPVRAVENRIIDVDRGPLVVAGVRGHTDIDSSAGDSGCIFTFCLIITKLFVYWLCTSQ